MTIALVTLLIVLSIFVIAFPFFGRRPGEGEPEPADEVTAQLRRARDRVYEEIRALQQEHFLENLTDEEYQEQLQAARKRAADLIRQQRDIQEMLLDAEETVEEALERAIQRDGEAVEKPQESAGKETTP